MSSLLETSRNEREASGPTPPRAARVAPQRFLLPLLHPDAWILLGILVGAGAIRLAWAPHSLWYDEIASLKISEKSYAVLWSDWMRRETNPPLYYTALRAWRGLFGSSDVAVRALSMVFGLAGIVAAGTLAQYLERRQTGLATARGAGLLAAILIALAPAQVLFSQEVRAYILAYTAALIALLGAVVVMADADRPTRRRLGLLLYGIATTGALYAHTTMVVLPLIVNLYAAVWFAMRQRRSPRLAIEWLAVNALVLLAWSWWLQITVWQVGHATNVGWITRPSATMAAYWVINAYVPQSIGPVRLLVGLLMAGLVMRATWVHRHGPAPLLTVVAIAAPSLLFLLSFVTPVMLPRTIFWASGPFMVMVALGLASLSRRFAIAGTSVLGVALFVGCYISTRKTTVEPWRRMVETIEHADPEALVVAGDPGVAFALQHYCVLPECRITIFTMPVMHEAWSADMPRPRPHPPSYFGVLAGRHRLFSATRGGRGDLTPVASAVAVAHSLRPALDLPATLELVEWTPRAPKVPVDDK